MIQPGSIECINSDEGFDALKSDWQRLSLANPARSLFSDWSWNRLWWKHYSGLGELHILVLRRDGVVRAIAPFYRSRMRILRVFKTDALRFLGIGGDTSPDDLDVLMDPLEPEQTIDELCEFLLSRVDVTWLNWSDLVEGSRFAQRFVHLAEQQAGFLRRVEPVVRLVQPLPDTLEQHRRGLSRNARKHLKRRRKRLVHAGDAEFAFCRTHEQVDDALDALVALHRARHLSKGDDYSFASDAYRAFHRELMHELLDRDELRLLTLKLEGRIIGVEYAFEHAGALCFFQTGFDPEFEWLSPGHLMMSFMIDDAIERGVASLDLLKGEYPYKGHYAGVLRHSLHVDYCKPGAMLKLMKFADLIRRRSPVSRIADQQPGGYFAECPDAVNLSGVPPGSANQ